MAAPVAIQHQTPWHGVDLVGRCQQTAAANQVGQPRHRAHAGEAGVQPQAQVLEPEEQAVPQVQMDADGVAINRVSQV